MVSKPGCSSELREELLKKCTCLSPAPELPRYYRWPQALVFLRVTFHLPDPDEQLGLGTTDLKIKLISLYCSELASKCQSQATLGSSIRGLTFKMSTDAMFHLFYSFQVQHECSLSSIVRRREFDWATMRFGWVGKGIRDKVPTTTSWRKQWVSLSSSQFHQQQSMKATGVWAESRELTHWIPCQLSVVWTCALWLPCYALAWTTM